MTDRYRVLFLDQMNIARGKYIPETKGSSVRFCVGSYSSGYSGEQPRGLSAVDGYYDIEARFDRNEARQSWEDGTKILLADIYLDGEPFPLCGRSALKRAVDAWRAEGLEPIVGYETEACIFESDYNNWKPYNRYNARFYGTGAFADPDGLINDIWHVADWCDLPLESVHSEYDPSQFEFTLKCDEALKATDNVFLFKQMSREILIKQGYLLSYMPVPKTPWWNALHFNISFRDKNGNNVFSADEMPKVMKSSIAGLLHHHKSLSAIVAPTVNSYERVQDYRPAGYWANWSKGSRFSSVRVSTEIGERARIEYRVADYSANPYFALAAILHAMLIGYKKNYQLYKPETTESLKEKNSDQHTPHKLSKSLEYLQNDLVLTKAIGQPIIDHYIALKNKEVEEIEGKSIDEQFEYYSYFI